MAHLDKNILFGNIIHHLDPEIRKMVVGGLFWSIIFRIGKTGREEQ